MGLGVVRLEADGFPLLGDCLVQLSLAQRAMPRLE